jgi:hypothetical protein
LKYPWPFGKIKREGVKPSSLNNNPMKMQNICSFSAFKQPIELIIIGKQKQKMTTKSNVFFPNFTKKLLDDESWATISKPLPAMVFSIEL